MATTVFRFGTVFRVVILYFTLMLLSYVLLGSLGDKKAAESDETGPVLRVDRPLAGRESIASNGERFEPLERNEIKADGGQADNKQAPNRKAHAWRPPSLNLARMEKIEFGELGRIEGLDRHFDREELDGVIVVNLTEPRTLDSIPAIRNSNPPLESGGKWTPNSCFARCTLAVVMTHRERLRNLKLLLQHLHPFLQRQCIAYQMFVVEPEEELVFNRGMLKNIGFVESQKLAPFDCVVFHDLDVLPENIFNLYECHDNPRHLMTALDTTDYVRMEKGTNLFGGAVLFKSSQFQKVNGYSNLYFGWGSEDTDLMYRSLSQGLIIERPTTAIGRYKEAKHTKDPNRPIRNQALHARCMYRFYDDGLNTLNYKVLERRLYPGYTWLYVRYNDTKYIEDGDEFILRTDMELGQNFSKYMHITNRQSFPVPQQKG